MIIGSKFAKQWLRRRGLLASLGFLLLMLCVPARAEPALSLKGPRPVVWADFLGVNAQLLWFDEVHYRQQLDLLQALGLSWVRVDLHWDRLEPAPGQWQLTELDRLTAVLAEKKLKSLLYLVGSAPFASSAPSGSSNADQYPPLSAELFAESLGFLAQRYPTVNAWQVWNEPNISPYWQPMEDPLAYQQLLETSLTRLASANPAAQQVLGGMAYYSQMPLRGGLMLEALANLGSVRSDRVVAYHPYSFTPEGDSASDRDFLSTSAWLNQQLRARGSGPIWATEFGWSTYSGPVEWQPQVDELGQADYLIKRIALMSAMDFDRVFLFTLSDLDARASVRDQHYGLLRLDGSKKPAYLALQRFLKTTGPSLQPQPAPEFATAPAGMISIAWQRTDGRWVWLFWAQEPGQVRLQRQGSGTLYNPLKGTSKRFSVGTSGALIEVGREMQIVVM
ncbi:MAG: beta-xylosidase [Pseudomonadales bacterium RIFCSPLOWO2_12_59_9]|nr:MAG: beta-xylosidase [Pseudomonadales bacterium RIFCSPLOWO2_12_59_9]